MRRQWMLEDVLEILASVVTEVRHGGLVDRPFEFVERFLEELVKGVAGVVELGLD